MRNLVRAITILPWIWHFTFIIGFLYGYIHLGHVPIYGIDKDPYAMNFGSIGFLLLFLLAMNLWGFIIMIIAISIMPAKDKTSINNLYIHLIIYSLGIALFFYLKTTNIYSWVMD